MLDPTPIINYYQCYTKYNDDDDKNTIITSNLRENRSENSNELNQQFIVSKLRTQDKYSSDQVVEPVTAPKVAKLGTRVQILLRETEARGTSSVPTTYQCGRVVVPPMSFAEESLQCLARVANNFQRKEVRGQAKSSIYSRADAWKKTIFDDNLSDLPNADTCSNTGRIKIAVDMAVVDAGATGNFVLLGIPAIDVLPTLEPISINLPDGSVIKSTHICRINIP